MIKFVEKDTATNYFEKCEKWEEQLSFERQNDTPIYIRTGVLSDYYFIPPVSQIFNLKLLPKKM